MRAVAHRFPAKIAAAFAVAIFAAGCRTPMPPGAATSGLRLGPFFETARDDSGSRLVAVRPFFSLERTGCQEVGGDLRAPRSDGASTSHPAERPEVAPYQSRSETDILWPLGVRSQRDDHYYWRALLFYGTDTIDDPTSPNDPWRFRLFPFIYAGRTQEGEDYGAFFPFYGTIRDFLVFHETSFVLFPIYAEGRSPTGVEMRTVLWPFYLTRHGERLDQFRLWPFYGTAERRNLHATSRSRFVVWPIWSDASSKGEIEGSGFILFPIYGHSRYEREKRGVEESWSVIPPLFQYARGDDGYRKLFAPWPFIRFLDNDGIRERHVWPLWGHTERWPVGRGRSPQKGGGRSPQKGRGRSPSAPQSGASIAAERPEVAPHHLDLTRTYFLWPFFSRTETDRDGVRRSHLHAPLPFFFRREEEVLHPDVPGGVAQTCAKSRFTRLWPLFSYRRSTPPTPNSPTYNSNSNSNLQLRTPTPHPVEVRGVPPRTGGGEAAAVFLRVPELSLWSKSEQVERNWAPLWSLYTFRRKPTGAYCNDILWGLLSWGRNDDGGAIFSIFWINLTKSNREQSNAVEGNRSNAIGSNREHSN